MRSLTLLSVVAGLALAADGSKLPPPATFPVDFTRDIEPLFKARCQGCHGANLQSSGLRLDNAEGARKGGYSGAVIRPGASADSRLVLLVAGADGKLVMPPAGARLTAAEVGLLRAWIDQGATWPASPMGATPGATGAQPVHWAWQSVRSFEPPQTQNRNWARTPIDAFVLERLEREGIEPSPEASRTTLARRLYLDLTGLLPSPKDVAEFLADNRPESYERLVDRLLESPHYGEKWAAAWLGSGSGPANWRYRQWLIDALNRGLPFDQFTIQQIAGDLVANSAVDQKIATGYLRDEPSDQEECRIAHRVAKVAATWFGLTLRCGPCDDRPCDAGRRADFDRLYPFFENSREAVIDAPLPGEMGPFLGALPTYLNDRDNLLRKYDVERRQAVWEKRIQEARSHPGTSAAGDRAYQRLRARLDSADWLLDTPPARRTQNQADAMTDCFVQETTELAELGTKLAALRTAFPALSQASVLVEAPGSRPQRATPLATAGFLPPFPAADRLSLATWLLSPANPLTPRVIINRMWGEFFSCGFFAPDEGFGSGAKRPSNPELLDWLAAKFRDSGGRVKAMHRLIVTSAVYRQSSEARLDLGSHDSDISLFARQSKRRLSVESLRDVSLQAGQLLDLSVGGNLSPGGKERYRRSLYRIQPGDEGISSEVARALAARLMQAFPPEPSTVNFSKRVRLAFLICFSRTPTSRDLEELREFYSGQVQGFEKNAPSAMEVFPVEMEGFTSAESAAWTAVGRKLLEHDEFKMRD
jgi:mono/diheme cytochrome c family protein